MAKKLTNIRTLPSGSRQAMPRIKGKLIKPRTYPAGTPDSEILAWIEEQQRTHGGDVEAGSIEADATAYVAKPEVKRLATIKQITTHLGLWLDALGRDRTSRSVTTDELNAVIVSWLDAGLATETVRKRCTSLQSCLETMCPTHKNPFHKSLKPKLPLKLEARGVDLVLVERILAAMPDTRTDGAPSLGKIVCRLMTYTGLAPESLNEIAETDLVLVGSAPYYRVARSKVESVEPRTFPLADNPDALAAFRDFHRVKGYGRVKVKSASAAWRKARVKVGGEARRVRLYDIRHSFLTQAYRVTRDLATVARLAMHADGSKMTARYARGANGEVDAAAIAAFTASLHARRAAAAAQAGATVLAFQHGDAVQGATELHVVVARSA